MKKGRWFTYAMLVSLWTASFCWALSDNDIEDRIYNMTAAEVEEVVSEYLRANSFKVYYQYQTQQMTSILAEKGATEFRIITHRHSPIASRVVVEPVQGDAHAAAVALQAYLDSYINLPNPPSQTFSDGIPDAVRRYHKAVVCLYATGKENEVQLTGFAVDATGMIVCTGHDLKVGEMVNVLLIDGREVPGQVVKIDYQLDLALVHTQAALDYTVPLKNGRFMLQNGDRLFAITCPNGRLPSIEPGFIDGPPRRVQTMPLWQVRMHIKHGSSGSPVFDRQGRLVAIVKGRYRGTETIGFLIPFETILQFLEKY